jgi:hypothetical protein
MKLFLAYFPKVALCDPSVWFRIPPLKRTLVVPNRIIRRDLQTPRVKEEIRSYSSPQRTPKRPSSEPLEATRQQAIAKTNAKWSAYQIPSVIVVFVVLVCKVWFVSLIPESHKRP